jgi:hypothetical protein
MPTPGTLRVQEEESEEEKEEEKPAAKKQKAADGSSVDVSAVNGSRTIFMKNLAWAADEVSLAFPFSVRAGPGLAVAVCMHRCCLLATCICP